MCLLTLGKTDDTELWFQVLSACVICLAEFTQLNINYVLTCNFEFTNQLLFICENVYLMSSWTSRT